MNTPLSRSAPLFRDFIGINENQSAEPFPPALYRPVASLVRDYHSVLLDLGSDTAQPSTLPLARHGLDWAARYAAMRAHGWRIDVSLMFETIAPGRWHDLAADARAYAEQFAHVFGPTHGGLVEAVEIGNEPGTFSDEDFRRVFVAMAEGFRAGDPRLLIATPAMTTGASHAFAKSTDALAGLDEFYDVLTVHTYAELEAWPTWQRSFPEDPRLQKYLPDVRWLCAWRDRHAPTKPVWITEFGYDAHDQPPDPHGPHKWWRPVDDLQQAQWTVRSWLMFATLPVERAYHYYFNDHGRPSLHAAAGLTRDYQPRPVFHAAAHLQRTLGDYRYAGLLVNRPGDAMLADFAHEHDATRRIWVAWSPTGTGRSASLVLPPWPGAVEKIELMPTTTGDVTVLASGREPGEIVIHESPTYLLLRQNNAPLPSRDTDISFQ